MVHRLTFLFLASDPANIRDGLVTGFQGSFYLYVSHR